MDRNGINFTMEQKTRWLRLVILMVALIALSFGLSYLIQKLVSPHLPILHRFDWVAYIGIFFITLLSNLTIVAPVPIATAIMISLATQFNPALLALFAALGGCLGELSGYYAGYLGEKIAINESAGLYQRIEEWMSKYGTWAISFLAFQPIIPFDIGGIVAGAARMPIWKLLPALFLGKFPKYLILAYSGAGLIHFFRW